MGTNKLAAQIGRPLSVSAALSTQGCLEVPGDLGTPSPTQLRRICDGGDEGAIIHAARIHSVGVMDAPTRVLLYVSDQSDPSRITPENTRLVAFGVVPALGLQGV